jgi:hypothetical protein
MRAKRPRGIILISVMFLAILIGMYIGCSAILTKGQYGALHQSAEDRRAEEAARSGLEYAQARLEENPLWRGDGNGLIVDTPSLIVREDRGNVIGVLSTSDGGLAQFRLRFNYQDGANGGDAMDDPSADMWIDSPHISINNLPNPFQSDFPLGDGANYSWQGNATPTLVPGFTAALVCEGRVFDELGAANANNPNPASSGVRSSRAIEAMYRISDFTGEAPAESAVTMAGGDVDVQLFPNENAATRMAMSNFQGSGPSQLRSRGDVYVTDVADNAALVDGTEANLLLPPDKNLTAMLASGVQRGDEDVSSDFYKLTWDQAGQIPSDAAPLKAGVYVYWSTDQQLHYYDKDYETYLSDIRHNPSDPGQVATLPAGMTFVPAGTPGPDNVTSTRQRFVVTDDIKVEATTSGVKDLTIVPRGGAKEEIGDPPPEDAGVDLGVDLQALGITAQSAPGDVIPTLILQGGGVAPNSAIHKLLLGAADGAVLNTGSGNLSWSTSTIDATNFTSLESTLKTLMAGSNSLKLEGVTNPNLEILEPVGNSGKYRFRDDALARLLTGTGTGLQEVDLEQASGGAITNASEPLGASDFELTLAPQSREGVRLVAPGDVRIAADVKGSGASLMAEGDIRLVGMGFDLDAANGGEGTDVSLYSKRNIVISTLRKKQGEYAYAGLALRGVLYSWGDIRMKMSDRDETSSPDPQKVYIQGTMVAYGGQPGVDAPGTQGGNITIKADQVDLVFDPGYLVGVQGGNNFHVTLAPLSQAFRQ